MNEWMSEWHRPRYFLWERGDKTAFPLFELWKWEIRDTTLTFSTAWLWQRLEKATNPFVLFSVVGRWVKGRGWVVKEKSELQWIWRLGDEAKLLHKLKAEKGGKEGKERERTQWNWDWRWLEWEMWIKGKSMLSLPLSISIHVDLPVENAYPASTAFLFCLHSPVFFYGPESPPISLNQLLPYSPIPFIAISSSCRSKWRCVYNRQLMSLFQSEMRTLHIPLLCILSYCLINYWQRKKKGK